MKKILIKKFSTDVKLPRYETKGSSGMDISAFINEKILISPKKSSLIPTGIALSIPKGFEAQIRPRSGLAAKNNITILNTPGTIDSDYRGEVKIILFNLGTDNFVVENGDRIAQMVICPIIQAEFEEVEDLSNTVRGKDGFGSTGV
jgi:dUTP pyrophosphatase|tara:strand:+ start:3251 stop:3688 length:438 start_codon:yes stop_codon:yes gene_type:complete